MKKLIIFGAGETATIAAEFFSQDSNESIYGFGVDDKFLNGQKSFYNSPLLGTSQILSDYSPSKFRIFVALSYGQLNQERLLKYNMFKDRGYEFATYISSKASVWRTADIGENCMIFENNNIQHNSIIEDNCILWSGNHIGHSSRIRNSSYISSHVCIAGYADIGNRCFLGINSSVNDKLKLADDCFVASGSVVTKNTQPNGIYSGNPAQRNIKVSAKKFFKVSDEI